jgi:heptosyltransferase I
MKTRNTSFDFNTLPFTGPPSSILIVRLSAHGDVIHTLPLLSAVKNQWPSVKVGWLCEPSSVPLLENHPLIDKLHVVKRPIWIKQLSNPLKWFGVGQEFKTFLREIQTEHYDVSFDVQGLLKSAIWPLCAGIPNRIGFKATREFADRFYTYTLPPMDLKDGSTPAIQRYLDFARLFGCVVESPCFVLPAPSTEAQNRALQILEQSNFERPLIALAPFTRWESKHWVFAYWRQIIQLLRSEDYRVLLLGGLDNVADAEELCSEFKGAYPNLMNAVGKTDWPTMQAVLNESDVLIGLDSAPLHMADALGKSIVGIYGPTAPGRTGPIGEKSKVLTAHVPCQPCFQKRCPLPEKVCMTHIVPDMVLNAVKNALN